MKILVNISRWLVGLLFIFSGLVKAIDPLGLTYKMEEFFEVWAGEGYLPSMMNWFHNHAFVFTIVMITLEVALGVALILGWAKKITLWLLLLLMLFFTFLTSYVLFSGKIRTCGCFGDCIPLTPIQTFTKDIILLALVIVLLFGQKYIGLLFKERLSSVLLLLSIAFTLLLQRHVLKHLPIVDCLPYKKGNNILELRKMPADAIPDKYVYSFVYEKNGENKDFTADKLPDSTWKFVDRKQTLIEKGKNNVPVINDFSLKDSAGVDVTETVMNQPEYYLLFLKALDRGEMQWVYYIKRLVASERNKTPVYIVTANKEAAQEFFNKFHMLELPIYTCDVTAIKTASRADPTLYKMKGPVVVGKYGWADIDDFVEGK